MEGSVIRGDLDQIITNASGLYEGDLVWYFQIIFKEAKNLNHPYHNFRHMMHVTWLCHHACIFYKEQLSKREMRNLLIGAMFHDFNHKGTKGPDILNIMISIEGLEKYILAKDRPFMDEIVKIIKATEYPYKTPSDTLNLCCQIVRDADLSQALNPNWLQQVIFGLAAEWDQSPLEVLRVQNDFHRKLVFCTDWGQQLWPKGELDSKIDEAAKLLKILEMPVEDKI